MSTGVTITGANFESEVLGSPIPVLVDFWAAWCGPCRAIGPLLDQIAGEYAGKLKLGKVNVDEENDLAGQYGIISIPTMIFFKDGKEVRKQVGSLPKQDIENLFKDLI